MKRYFLLLLSTVILAAGCGEKKEAPNQELEETVVSTTRAREKTYTPELQYSGTIKAGREANLGAAIPGRVEKEYYNEGSRVQKGDLLVQLSGELLTQAEAEYAAVKKDFERVSRLQQKGSISEQDYDHVKAKYEATLAKAQMMRKNTEITAPFDGTIIEYLVQEGENFFFSPGLEPGYSHSSGIVRLMQLNPVKIEAEINEKDLPLIHHGTSVIIMTDAFPDTMFRGTVSQIRPVLSTLSRTATVDISLPNPGHLLRPGMFASVRALLPATKGVAVPLSAVYRLPGTGNDYVYTVKDNITHRVSVQRGISIEDQIIVTGIEAGREIITAGKDKVSEGTKVVISNRKEE